MDIQFPSQLQWVTPLVGSHWPQGSESAWWRTAGYLHAHAAALETHIADLQKVRSQTQAVLVGETAQAFEQQTTQLFSGDTAVQKKVEALRSLGDAAETLGTEIQYTKLSIYSMLLIAAASIVFALANSEWTLGASLAQIPVIRWLTENAMARLVTMVLGRIEAELAARLGSMLVARLVVEGIVSAGIGAAQEGGIEAIQVAEGHRDGIDVGTVLHSALSMGLAGAAGGLAGHAVGGLVGTEGSTALRALKGAVTGLASAEAANLAGTLAGGGHVGADTLLGGAIGLVHGGLGGASGEHAASVQDPTESAVPANAIDTHPTLRFEKQPDDTFAWPGETTNDAGPQAHTASAPAPTTEPPAAAGELGAGASAGNGGSPAADPATATGDRVSGAVSHASPGAGDPGERAIAETSSAPPAAADAGHPPGATVTAGLDPPPAAPASVGSRLPEGTVDLSTSPANPAGPLTATAGPAISDPPLLSNAVNPATQTPPPAAPPSPSPTVPSAAGPPASAPTSTPASPGPNAGLSNPTADPHAGPAEISPADKPSSQPAGAPAAGRFDTTAAGPGAGAQDTTGAEQTAAAPAVGVDRATPAGRSEAGSHAVGRQDTVAEDRQQRAAEPTKRQDPSTRPDSNRRDSATGPRGRPGKLRSGVARDTPEHIQPAAATHASDPLAAAEDIGVIKAHHDDSGPGPGEPQSHQGGDDSRNIGNTPDTGTTGGGAGHGGSRGGAGAGGLGDGSGRGDPPDRGDGGGASEEPGRDDFKDWEQEFPPDGDEPEEGSPTGAGDGGNDGLAGHGEGAGDPPGRDRPVGGADDDSRPVERYFQTHRPSGDDGENRQPGDGLRRVAEVVSQIYGREIHLEPGANNAADLLKAAGSWQLKASYAEVGDTLDYVGRGSLAIVASGWADGSGGTFFLAANIGGEIRYYDPESEMLADWPPPWDQDQVRLTFAGYLDAHGDPLLPDNEYSGNYPALQKESSAALARLSEADKAQLNDFLGEVKGRFASAMTWGVVPGSDEANALAEQHKAIWRWAFDGYNYEMHRAEGRLLVTLGGLRDPLEQTAPGLARYMRNVIVANADHHLNPADDAHTPEPAGPRQPENPPSDLNLGTGEPPQRPTADRADSNPDESGRGSDQGGPPDSGRAAESHPVARYFETRSEAGYAIEHRQPSDGVRHLADVVSQIYGRELHLESGDNTAAGLFKAARTGGLPASYVEIGHTLEYVGPDSSALVMSNWSDGSGGTVFLAANIGGDIHYYDPTSEMLADWPPPWSPDQVSSTLVAYLDAHGDPLLPLREYGEHWATAREEVRVGLARMSNEEKSQLNTQSRLVKEIFASAMTRGVEPGSDEANALAEQHMAIWRRVFAGYDYETHRTEARQNVTHGALRDPLERIAPGLARYMRDVIVANADRHLSLLDDPDAPAGSRQPENPPSSRDPATVKQSQLPTVHGDGSGFDESDRGLGKGGHADHGRDGDSHSLMERYFQTHPPSGDTIENRQPGLNEHAVGEALTQIYGREFHIEPGHRGWVDPLEAVGADHSEGDSYAEVGDTLRYAGRDSSAIVVSDWADRRGGAIFLAVNIGDEIRYYDPASRVLADWPPPWPENQVSRTIVGYLDAHGDPLCPAGEYDARWHTAREEKYAAVARLPAAERSQMMQDMGALLQRFTAAMNLGVPPGSDVANALAEEHMDYWRRVYPQHDYRLERADARRSMIDGDVRARYERYGAGLTRYMRDVIVANAARHLGPDDPQPPDTAGPRQPGNPPSGSQPGTDNSPPATQRRRRWFGSR